MKSSSGYEIYHNTLSSCLDEVENYIQSKGYQVGDYFPLINHVAYGHTERTQVEMIKNGKVANSLSIQIYRMESGRYELNCYPVRRFATGGYTRPSYDLKTSGTYLFRTNKGSFYVFSFLFERENDTEDSLEIQDDLRDTLGSILIKNSAWRRLASGKSIKAKSSKGGFEGILTRVDDVKNSNKYVKSTYNTFHNYGTGGSTDEQIDLFETPENIPPQVQEILNNYSEEIENGDYKGLSNAVEELEQIGYTFDFYVDGSAYDLRPMKKTDSSEEFATGGGVGSIKIGNKYLYKFDNKIYEVMSIEDHLVHLHNTKGLWWDNRKVTISLMKKWIQSRKMIKQK